MDALGRHCLKCQPSSRTGENPPYGMIGGTVETSASFEARYAPLSYPTGGDQRWSFLPQQLIQIGNLFEAVCEYVAASSELQATGTRRAPAYGRVRH